MNLTLLGLCQLLSFTYCSFGTSDV